MKVEKMVPEVYYKESRDFAYIGRLIEILFNYMKTGADCVNTDFKDVNIDANILELMCDTLGFEIKHRYVTKDLLSVISNFSDIIKKKGTLEAVDLAVRALINSQELNENISEVFLDIDKDNNVLRVYLHEKLTDTILLEDLFDYILPVGTTYEFIKLGNGNAKFDNIITIKSDIDDLEIKREYDEVLAKVIDKNSLDFISTEEGKYGIGTIYTGVVLPKINLIYSLDNGEELNDITNNNIIKFIKNQGYNENFFENISIDIYNSINKKIATASYNLDDKLFTISQI